MPRALTTGPGFQGVGRENLKEGHLSREWRLGAAGGADSNTSFPLVSEGPQGQRNWGQSSPGVYTFNANQTTAASAKLGMATARWNGSKHSSFTFFLTLDFHGTLQTRMCGTRGNILGLQLRFSCHG